MIIKVSRENQRGSTMAEFAVVAGVFFMMIIGIIEFSRLLYTHNALTDATRRGARYAVLHPENAPCVTNVVVYGETNINPATCAPLGPPLINGLTPAMVTVVYSAPTPNRYGLNLGTATVMIQTYTFNLSIPFFRQFLTMPKYSTTLTAESAGNIPPDI
jgi:hypothetical protein